MLNSVPTQGLFYKNKIKPFYLIRLIVKMFDLHIEAFHSHKTILTIWSCWSLFAPELTWYGKKILLYSNWYYLVGGHDIY